MTKTRNLLNRLISTLWFVPGLFVAGGVLLGILLTGFDFFFHSPFRDVSILFGVQPSGARDILAVIAGSTITVAGTVFSITIVALTLASTQFSPRVLRNFMRDSGNQAVLGMLVGIFAYCIVVLRTIREGSQVPEENFVPSTAVFVAVLLALVGIGFLIYFIHHVATSIQATKIISTIADETIKEIRKNFPTELEKAVVDKTAAAVLSNTKAITVTSNKTGYVQNADLDDLVALAVKHDLLLRLQRRTGQFTIEGLPLIEVFPLNADGPPDPEICTAIRNAYTVNIFRTVGGDVAFGLRQIVDIALKALSPSVNDTTTAVTCVDYLTAIMVCLARRPSCSSLLYAEGKLRVMLEQQHFEDFFDLAFNQIRQNASGNVAVIFRQLNSLNILSRINGELPFKEEKQERLELVMNQARLLVELARKTIKADSDREIIERIYLRVKKSL